MQHGTYFHLELKSDYYDVAAYRRYFLTLSVDSFLSIFLIMDDKGDLIKLLSKIKLNDKQVPAICSV